jgi:threonine dehydrogenase-like Zn-dependent dehydrogenase/predicted NBD/HSP70 family sugar kinase
MSRLSDRPVICVDMGGTTTRVATYDGQRVRPGAVRFPTPKPPPGGSVREEHLGRVAAAVERLRPARLDAGGYEVGVAVGATVDGRGRVRYASMLWHEVSGGFDLAGALAARLPGASVSVRNDIEAAAWRYRTLGRFALITISTGVAAKVFDDSLPFDHRVLLDADALGGEIGHVRVDQPGAPEPTRRHRSLGPAAAAGDGAARAALAAAGLPWCECGNVGDLCAYASGPASVRLAAMLAATAPERWCASGLRELCQGRAERLSTHDIAGAAQRGDEFAIQVLRTGTRPLAASILHMSALLGLRRFVVMGGFALGVGTPWFAALRASLGDLLPGGGWFTGWTGADLDALVQPALDGDDSLAGMGAFLHARRAYGRELVKPVGRGETVLRRRDPQGCGREQFAVAVAFAGICGTDLQILRGERGCEPGVLGHECVARVVEVGADVIGVSPGQVVAVNPNHPHDEHDKIGHNQPGILRDGVVWDRHMVERGQVVGLPDAGRAEWVLVEPLSCTVRSLRLAADPAVPAPGCLAGRTVLVIGAGVSGLLHVLLARHWGADRVLLANRDPQRMQMAVAGGVLGPDDCLPLEEDLCHSVLEATGGSGVDTLAVSVSAAGPSIVEQLWPGLADAATVHLFGGFPPDATLAGPGGGAVPVWPVRQGTSRRLTLPGGRSCTLVGSRGASVDDFRTAVELATGSGRGPGLDLAPLVSHVVSLEAAPDVLTELAATGRVAGEAVLRVVVDLRLPGRVVRPVSGAVLPSLRGPGTDRPLAAATTGAGAAP